MAAKSSSSSTATTSHFSGYLSRQRPRHDAASWMRTMVGEARRRGGKHDTPNSQEGDRGSGGSPTGPLRPSDKTPVGDRGGSQQPGRPSDRDRDDQGAGSSGPRPVVGSCRVQRAKNLNESVSDIGSLVAGANPEDVRLRRFVRWPFWRLGLEETEHIYKDCPRALTVASTLVPEPMSRDSSVRNSLSR